MTPKELADRVRAGEKWLVDKSRDKASSGLSGLLCGNSRQEANNFTQRQAAEQLKQMSDEDLHIFADWMNDLILSRSDTGDT